MQPVFHMSQPQPVEVWPVQDACYRDGKWGVHPGMSYGILGVLSKRINLKALGLEKILIQILFSGQTSYPRLKFSVLEC